MRISDSFYQLNRAAILAALRENGVESVTVEYAGSGDSGQIEGVSELPNAKVTIHEAHSTFSDGEWRDSVTQEERTLEQAVEWLCYEVLERHHPGWEINDGSNGSFEFDPAEGTINLIHNYFTVETEEKEV